MVTKRRWNSFVCPGCRFVFRIPRDHDGQGTVCPSCHVMLRLPAEGEETSPLVKAAVSSAAADPHEGEVDDAEEAGETSSVVLLVGMTVAGLVLLAGFAFWLKPRVAGRPAPVAITVPVIPLPSAKKDSQPDTQVDGLRILRDSEPTVRGFLEAKTMEEALKFVFQPERVRSRWQQMLQDQPYEIPGCKEIDKNSISVTPKYVAFKVTTGNFSKRSLALRLVEGGAPMVDWESWVGWSEMSWADFRRQKPTEPKLFRVILSKADYYNFDFANESEWSSYRLDSPDKEDSLHGYATFASPLDSEIRPFDAKDRVRLMLRLRFPENARNDSQVIIEGTLGQGWLEP
ncbi:MAG: hypothetical protein JWO82_4106 [Akkermansiaceae bacterium]|nr:hypothetical protein [Akkermansiaceae bacterium]